MKDHTTRFITVVKNQLGERILPALPEGMDRYRALMAYQIMGRLVTDAAHAPAIQADAVRSYSALQSDLSAALGSSTDKPLLDELSAQLSAAAGYDHIRQVLQKVIVELSMRDDAAARALIRKVNAIEQQARCAELDAYFREIEAQAVQAAPAVLSDDEKSRLAAFLRTVFTQDTALELGALKHIPGGFSKKTIIIQLNNVRSAPPAIVIRMDQTDTTMVGTTVVNEFNLIRTLHAAGVAVAEPYALEASGTVLPGRFLVLGKVDGSNIGDYWEITNGSKDFALDLARNLARIHSVPVSAFGPDVNGASQSTQERLLGEMKCFEDQWRTTQIPSINLETTFAWLKKNIHLADGPRALVHKDVGCHNMLVENHRLTALLDWETAAIGNPAQDLGYAYKSVIQMCSWDEFMQAYAQTATTVPDAAQITFYTLWGYTWLTCMAMYARHLFTSGEFSDIQVAYGATYSLAQLEAQLGNQLAKML